MNLKIDIQLSVDYDEQTKKVNILSCNPVIITPSNEETIQTHIVTETQHKFGILTFGKNGKNIPKGREIKIEVNEIPFENTKTIVTHKTVTGRIDGLTEFYKNYPNIKTGTELKYFYDVENDTLKLSLL